MAEATPPKAGLMLSLRRLVRGLSALFWGLPFTLVVCVQSTGADWIRPLGVFPPVFATGLLLYGLHQLSYFHRTERPWALSLETARLLAVVNLGLSPFVFLRNRVPSEPFFDQAFWVLALSCILFLAVLNRCLRCLSAMLPDETLREETRMFTSLNVWLIGLMLTLVLLHQVAGPFLFQSEEGPAGWIVFLYDAFYRVQQPLLLFLILLPLSITMTVIWKIKEVVLAGVFSRAE